MTMRIYNSDGTTNDVPYDPDVLAFVHEDFQIRDPMISECGRFKLDPINYGFTPYHTGGGCMALRRELENGDYLLLTDSDGSGIPTQEDAKTALLGRYTAEGVAVAVVALGDIVMDSEG